jgi:prepilin peptidase CpaA
MDWLATAILAGLLLVAAFTDTAARIIPDGVSAALALTGGAFRLGLSGPVAFGWSAAVAAALLALLVLLHARGLLGGGDAKLAAAVCLGLSPLGAWHFVFATAMAGGALALLHLAARIALRGARPCAPPPRGSSFLKRIYSAERWRISRHGSIPYGVAIACGGLWVVLQGHGP